MIDGKVYDEYVSVVEMAHTLSACINGHVIEVGFDGAGHSFARADGKTVAEKRKRIASVSLSKMRCEHVPYGGNLATHFWQRKVLFFRMRYVII